MDRHISEVNVGENEYIRFELFEVWFSIFSLKEVTMKNIHNRNAAELAYCITMFLTRDLWSHCFST